MSIELKRGVAAVIVANTEYVAHLRAMEIVGDRNHVQITRQALLDIKQVHAALRHRPEVLLVIGYPLSADHRCIAKSLISSKDFIVPEGYRYVTIPTPLIMFVSDEVDLSLAPEDRRFEIHRVN